MAGALADVGSARRDGVCAGKPTHRGFHRARPPACAQRPRPHGRVLRRQLPVGADTLGRRRLHGAVRGADSHGDGRSDRRELEPRRSRLCQSHPGREAGRSHHARQAHAGKPPLARLRGHGSGRRAPLRHAAGAIPHLAQQVPAQPCQ